MNHRSDVSTTSHGPSGWASLFGGLLLLGLSSSAMAQARVLPGEIKDTRTTGTFSSGLEVELKVLGDTVAEARAVRATVETATDDTGRSLISAKESTPRFNELAESDRNAATVTLALKNPARQAMTIREISGAIELFLPGRDPGAVVTVADIRKTAGTPIAAPALKAAGVEVTMWTKAQFDARKKAEDARRKSQTDKAGAVGEAVAKAFSGMFGFGEMSEGSLWFQLKGAGEKIVGIEFQDAKGAPLSTSGTSSIGDPKEQTRVYDLGDKLSQAARVRIYVVTAKSVVRAPFKLVSLPLP